jgi:hypothetical protein
LSCNQNARDIAHAATIENIVVIYNSEPAED